MSGLPGQMSFLDISYMLLWVFALTAGLMLHRVMRETTWLLQEHSGRKRRSNPRLGPLPEFTASTLETGKAVSAGDLIGREAILMFVKPADGSRALDKQLQTSSMALMEKAFGNLYVVCTGNAEDCWRLVPDIQFQEQHKMSEIPILLDEDGSIAQAFHVTVTPVAFQLDPKGQIVRYGEQRSSASLEKGEH